MLRNTLIGLVAALVGLSSASSPTEWQQYARSDPPTLGYVGCRFSQTLCSFDEECVDDGLFGNCQKLGEPIPDFYQPRLSKLERDQLEAVLGRLLEYGYSWSDSYTQCIITGVLLTYRARVIYDLRLCDDEQRDDSRRKPTFEGQEFGRDDDVERENDVDEVPVPASDFQTDDVVDYQPLDFATEPEPEIDQERDTSDGDIEIDQRDGRSEETGDAELERFLSGLSDEEIVSLEDYVARLDGLVDDAEQEKEEAGDAAADYENGDDDIAELQPSVDENDAVYEEDPAMDKKDDRTVDSGPLVITRVNVNYDPGTDDETALESPDACTEKSPETESNDAIQQAPEVTQEKPEKQELQKQEVQSSGENKDDKQLQRPVANSQPLSLAPPTRPLVYKTSPGGGDNQPVVPARLTSGNENSVPSNLKIDVPEPVQLKPVNGRMGERYVMTMYVLCGLIGSFTLGAIVIYVVRRRSRLHEKLANWTTTTNAAQKSSEEYQDLCRQHMQVKMSEKLDPIHSASRVDSIAAIEEKAARAGSTGSSTSSWTEEPVTSNLDISTGHIVLAYMEDHLKNKDRLQQEWEMLSAYDPEPCSIVAAIEPTNMRKNRYTDILPYEHSRVKLSVASNVSNSDFINASTITDHDPRNPAYIATQGPLPHTVADFWQMIWEQGCVVIVNLTRLSENGVTVCHRYWPEEGSDLYHIYEVHLVSEHVWCEDYVIRSFYLKNLQTSETRTVTQFHFVAWPNNEVPPSAKTLLDFRRKVNKSFRCRSSPIVVHCSDGAGRAGTYCLVDMVLNRLSKGAKEIDIAATLEHIRDQRISMVRTKEQFEFALAAVAHEVQAILHAPP